MMKGIFLSLFTLLVAFQTAHADFSYGPDGFDGGSLNGWAPKIGSWSVGTEGDGNHYLYGSSNYGVIWKDGSEGVDQWVQVDAFFDLSSYQDGKIAHLRLRTGDHLGATQRFWDTGYLAQFTPDSVLILNTYDDGNPMIVEHKFLAGESPITSSGWYTLTFEVTGTGSNTHFNMLVNGVSYIDDFVYNNTIDALDSGYIGLGRLIKYDNFSCSTDVAAVPTPTAAVLGILGLCTAGAKFRRRRNLKR
jgi:hypothetical protein